GRCFRALGSCAWTVYPWRLIAFMWLTRRQSICKVEQRKFQLGFRTSLCRRIRKFM
ncbi:unnamed protein product, partial [Mycena citricolor]